MAFEPFFLLLNSWVFRGWIFLFFFFISGALRLYFLNFSNVLHKYVTRAWKMTSYCTNMNNFVFWSYFDKLLAQSLQHIGIFIVFNILLEAQEFLNLKASWEFQPANFLKKFLRFQAYWASTFLKVISYKKKKCN